MKKILSIALCALTVFALVACGSKGSGDAGKDDTKQPPVLTGTWKQNNSESDDSYQEATITDSTIEVYWVADDTKALYWTGSFTAPTTVDEPYTWDSTNDTEKTSSALLASGDATKTFTYKDGTLSYEVTAMGVTKTVTMKK